MKVLLNLRKKARKLSREALHVGERAYFGIPDITVSDWQTGYYPSLRVNYLNGGKTPAWRIHTRVKLVFGPDPDRGDACDCHLKTLQMTNTFIPAQTAHDFYYTQSGFCVTDNKVLAITNRQIHLFVVVEIHYRDFRKVWHSQIFRAIFEQGHFHDYDASERDCAICKKKGYRPN